MFEPRGSGALHFGATRGVGSQALLGIPSIGRLRDEKGLSEVSRVWPFETGRSLPSRGDGRRSIFAEIYPSIVDLPDDATGRVKDSLQVEAIARHFARQDAEGLIEDLFAVPSTLEGAFKQKVENAEGWILGVR